MTARDVWPFARSQFPYFDGEEEEAHDNGGDGDGDDSDGDDVVGDGDDVAGGEEGERGLGRDRDRDRDRRRQRCSSSIVVVLLHVPSLLPRNIPGERRRIAGSPIRRGGSLPFPLPFENVSDLAAAAQYIKAFTGYHEFAEFNSADVGTLDSGLNSIVLASGTERVLLPLNARVRYGRISNRKATRPDCSIWP